MSDYADIVDEVHARTRPYVGEGKVADYIPALAEQDPYRFAVAIADARDGAVHCAGDADAPFSMQSISKVFTLALVLSRDDGTIWRRVHREPSGTGFNSLFQLEFEQGIPRNPFINPGALVVTDQLLSDTGDALGAAQELLRAETGNRTLDVDHRVAASEAHTGHRNRALGHLIADFGNMHNAVSRVLDHYFRQCSLTITCAELACAGLLLARHGLRADGSRLLSAGQARRVMALMLTCGTYDAAGEVAYRIGLPCKSGVGGGMLAIVPHECAVAAWGPGLDAKGNSVAALRALSAFTDLTGSSVF
jgi:glutaminase